jgi:NTE family protein
MMFMPRLRSGEPQQKENGASREPIIGLALGGGSARGWAHIGILKKLDEAGIRPKIVVGTSIGAVVGGSWASGKLPELEVYARSLTKRSMLGMMDWNIAGSGLLSGDRLRRALEERFKGALIEDLPVKFAAIATEIKTGHEIWLTRGPITDAMRASYALPGIFVPVNVAGRWLMDGALSNPVPVAVARALGAEMIIAVNLHTDVLAPASSTSMATPMSFRWRRHPNRTKRGAGCSRPYPAVSGTLLAPAPQMKRMCGPAS